MAQYPASVASLPDVTTRTKYSATLANQWRSECLAAQSDYVSACGTYNTLASYLAVARDERGNIWESVASHGMLSGVTASQHHNKLHAARHAVVTAAVVATDPVQPSRKGSVYQDGLMASTQAAKVGSLTPYATLEQTDYGQYVGDKRSEQQIDLGLRPTMVIIHHRKFSYRCIAADPNAGYKESFDEHTNGRYVTINNDGFNVSEDANIDGDNYYYYYTGESIESIYAAYDWLDLHDSYAAYAATTATHDLTTEDLGIFVRIKVFATGEDGTQTIVCKTINGNAGYFFGLNAKWGEYRGGLFLGIYGLPGGGASSFTVMCKRDIRDDQWHDVAAIIPRSTTARSAIYIDGIRDQTTTTAGGIASTSSISSNQPADKATFAIGRWILGVDTYGLNGQLREVVLATPADILASGEMGDEDQIWNMSRNPYKKDIYPSYEDYWPLDEGSGTTLVGDNNNLSLSSSNAWSLR